MTSDRLLVVLDVDSTFIREEVVDLLAERAGAKEEVRGLTEAAMRGEIDFAESLRARVATVAGLPASVLDDVLREVTVTPGAADLVAGLRGRGHVVALVSGGFVEIVRPLGSAHGISRVRANRLTVRDGVLTGEVQGAIVDRAGKAAALIEFAAAEGIPLARTVAVGDGANDLDMLDTAALGVAFCAKPAVRARADAAVDVADLRHVLPLVEQMAG